MCIQGSFVNCDKTNVGETARKLGVRLREHKPKWSPRPNELLPEVSAQPVSRNIVSQHSVTDHENQAHHTIGWNKTTVIDREQDRPTRWIKKAVHISQKGRSSSYELRRGRTAFLMWQLIVASRLGINEY